MLQFLILILCQTSAVVAFACNPYFSSENFDISRQRFVSPQAQEINGGGISEAEFNRAMDIIEQMYTEEVAKQGGELNVFRNWKSDTVNSFAYRDDNVWTIDMMGGYARHPLNTFDGQLMLACHEIGHHVGGAPTKPSRWAVAEGQSDYYANLVCLKKIMESDNNEEIVAKMNIPEVVKEKCASVYKKKSDQYLCQRVTMAGWVMNQVWTDGDTSIDFATPDTSVVSSTKTWHPNYQCRIDTSLQGALCTEKIASVALDNQDPFIGTCNKKNGYTIGLRPRCWYSEELLPLL
jgi:hypothetical protein